MTIYCVDFFYVLNKYFRCHFMNHNKTMLIGADTSHVTDRCIRVTIHHCFFDGTRQRHPRVRFAKVHLFNNYTRHWAIYAVGAGVESQVRNRKITYMNLYLRFCHHLSSYDSYILCCFDRYILSATYMKLVKRKLSLSTSLRR